MEPSINNIWFKAYTIYQKNPEILEEFIKHLRKNPEKALEEAKKITFAEEKPEAILLGFSPQPLIAALTVSEKITVITSPEVYHATIPQAKYSHETLKIFKKKISETIVTPLAPKGETKPPQIVENLTKKLKKIKNKTLDISGGTQLAAIAAYIAGIRKLTYTYPLGEKVVIYRLTI